jgi:hypothetical protein
MKRLLFSLALVALAGCGGAPDNSTWFIMQRDNPVTMASKGRPKVEGNTCTFVNADTGQVNVISGEFTIQQAPDGAK